MKRKVNKAWNAYRPQSPAAKEARTAYYADREVHIDAYLDFTAPDETSADAFVGAHASATLDLEF